LREGFSIPAQVALLRDYAERRDFEVCAVFEVDETARDATRRNDFGEMLAHLRLHPHDVLLVEKVDRLYRNEDDYFTLKGMGTEIHLVKEGAVIAPSTHSSQRMMHRISVAIAQRNVENLSEEVKKGMRRKCEEGGWPTWAPNGYVNVKDAVQKKLTGGLAFDPIKAPLVRSLFEAAATGYYSLGQLVTMAHDSGLRGRRGTPLGKSAVQYLLTNEAYTGTFMWGGVTYRGKYEAMIEPELYDRVQRALAGGSKAKTREHAFAYAGMIRCGACEGLLSGDRKKGKYVYYACRGRADCKRHYPEAVFEATTIEILNSLVIDDAVSAWIVSEMARWYDRVTASEAEVVTRLKRRLTEIKNMQQASYEDKLRKEIDEETWRDANAKWRAEALELARQVELAQPALSRTEFLAAASRPFELIQTAAAQYVKQSAAEKARLVRIICSNYRIVDGTVYASVRSPFDVMANRRCRSDWLGRLDDSRTVLEAYRCAVLNLAA
jgi:site-specific DNA recombinase